MELLHVASKTLEGVVRDAPHGVLAQRELLHHPQLAHGSGGVEGQLVPVQVQDGQVLHVVQRARLHGAQLVAAHVQPPQVLGPREGARPELLEPVVVKLQDEQVDHGRKHALRQVADLVAVQVEVGELREVFEGAGLDAGDVVVGQVEVDELLEPLEGLGGDLADLTVLQVQGDQALALAKGAGGQAAQGVPLHVQQLGGLRHAGYLLQPRAVTDDVLEVPVAVALNGALCCGSPACGCQHQETAPQQQQGRYRTHASAWRSQNTTDLLVVRSRSEQKRASLSLDNNLL